MTRGWRTRTVLAAGLLCAAALAPAAAQEPATHVLVIVGLGGDHENAERFHAWASGVADAARHHAGIPADRVVYLGEDVARDPRRIAGRSTRQAIAAAVDGIADRSQAGDRVLVVLFGHGAAAVAGAPRFNLPGPDLTAAEFARLLGRLDGRHVTFVNTASASGGFVPALSGPHRTIITATRSDGERNQTRFGGFFAESLTSPDADADKDGRVSMLEAFQYARGQVAASYERDGQLLTEHALLDDNGDGLGTDAPGAAAGDGAAARAWFLAAGSPGEQARALADPELRALVERRTRLEEQLAALRARRAEMDAGQYERELEQVLTALARTGRAIRERRRP